MEEVTYNMTEQEAQEWYDSNGCTECAFSDICARKETVDARICVNPHIMDII